VLSNPLLLWGIGFELAVSAAIVLLPGAQAVFGTAAPAPWMVLMLVPFPLVVWSIDEVMRAYVRRPGRGSPGAAHPSPS
jgi:FtsH-binding integral membrane protein